MKRSYFLPLISGAIVLFLTAAAVVEPTGEDAYTGSPIDGGATAAGQCSGCHNSPGTTALPTLSVSATPAFGGSGTNLTYAASTTYTVTGKGSTSGCSATSSITINVNNPPTVTANATALNFCPGSSVTINATGVGGTGNYTYSWSPGNEKGNPIIETSSAGTYTVTISDANSCTSSATVSVNGGTPSYTYSWNTTPAQTTATATGLSAGTYTVTVTDTNGCSTVASSHC